MVQPAYALTPMSAKARTPIVILNFRLDRWSALSSMSRMMMLVCPPMPERLACRARFTASFKSSSCLPVEGAGNTIETWPGAWAGSREGVTGKRSVWLKSVPPASSSSNSNSGPPGPIVIKE